MGSFPRGGSSPLERIGRCRRASVLSRRSELFEAGHGNSVAMSGSDVLGRFRCGRADHRRSGASIGCRRRPGPRCATARNLVNTMIPNEGVRRVPGDPRPSRGGARRGQPACGGRRGGRAPHGEHLAARRRHRRRHRAWRLGADPRRLRPLAHRRARGARDAQLLREADGEFDQAMDELRGSAIE